MQILNQTALKILLSFFLTFIFTSCTEEAPVDSATILPSGKITGAISVQEGVAKGINISLADGTASTITTANGSFVLANLSLGEHTLIINATNGDYLEHNVTLSEEENEITLETITLKTGVLYLSSVRNKINYSKPATLEGVIDLSFLDKETKNTKASTSSNSGLWLSPDTVKSLHTKPQKIEIDENGAYHVEDLQSGTNYSLIFINNSAQGSKLDNITLKPDTTTKQDITEISDVGSVILKVQNLTTSKALEDTTVTLNELGITTSTDENGDASFTNLPAGSYSLTFSKSGYASKYMSFIILGDTQTNLETIDLNTEKGSLLGQIELDGLDDYANVLLYAQGEEGTLYTTITNSSGAYSFVTIQHPTPQGI
jgi:hypothetical protein